MKARYLVRFDDICPTMNWSVWNRVEQILKDNRVSPILAIIPDNRDPYLECDPPNPNFWERARAWQERGWTIGLHGYQHQFVSDSPGILGMYPRSEFAGLPLEAQKQKVSQGLEILAAQKIRPIVWVAPAHTFDENTLIALRDSGIRTVSDGFLPLARYDALGMLWIPQQFWHFRRLPFGTYTVCCHANSWTDIDVEKFRRDIETYRNQFTTVQEVSDAAKRSLFAKFSRFVISERVWASFYQKLLERKRKRRIADAASN
jgi:predicted deacetylase